MALLLQSDRLQQRHNDAAVFPAATLSTWPRQCASSATIELLSIPCTANNLPQILCGWHQAYNISHSGNSVLENPFEIA